MVKIVVNNVVSVKQQKHPQVTQLTIPENGRYRAMKLGSVIEIYDSDDTNM